MHHTKYIESFIRVIFGKVSYSLLISIFLLSCGDSKAAEQKKKIAAEELARVSDKINSDFAKIRTEVKQLSDEVAALYGPAAIAQVLDKVDKTKYKLYKNGVFYKPVDDGKSAVFVSGAVPVDDKIKNTVYFTEPMDGYLMRITEGYPEVIQSYYNDRNSYNRIYPYFDVLTQYEPKMDIPSFNFYYLADAKHDPEKKAVWVNEPYVDPAGRGWMVSAIAPVYVDGVLEGVPGLDVTINTITDRYISQNAENMVILDSSGTAVSIQDNMANLFSLPMLENHKYLETIRRDTFRPDDYNILLSKVKDIREMALAIYKEGKKEVSLTIAGRTYTILAESIPELDWKILVLVE